MEPNVEEAERRIAEARATGAESLDLGDLRLGELPARLKNLNCLKTLYLGAFECTNAGKFEWKSDRKNPELAHIDLLASLQGLQSIDLSGTGVRDLTPVQGLNDLQNLNLSRTRVVDLAPLQSLQNLQSLYLSGTGVTDLTPLQRLHDLQNLHLSRTKVVYLASLRDLQNLQSLDLSGTGVTDLAPLQRLQNLQTLLLSRTGVVNLASLQGLQNLQSLHLSGTRVTDLEPIHRLKYLQTLYLSRTAIMDLAPLQELHDLKSLDLSITSVTDLVPLQGLQGLQTLHLSGTGVKDLGPLQGLHNLQTLNLLRTGVTNLTPLQGIQDLQTLNLSGTGVADLAPLQGLHDLQNLNLSRTDVTSLAPLQRLQSLQSLHLLNTGATDLAPLQGLQSLQSLNLSGTRVMDLAPLQGLHDLQTLKLSGTGVTSLAPLQGLQGLQSLDLSGTGATDLAPLQGLQSLQSLNLSGTGVMDLAPLQGLHDLQTLMLSGTGVTSLAPLQGLQGLQSLDLSGTGATDLVPLQGLQDLQTLNLSGTGITDLAPLQGLYDLQSINLKGTSVTGLEPLTALQKLQTLNLYGCRPPIPASILLTLSGFPELVILKTNEVTGVPREILSRSPYDNCLPRLRSYFSDLAAGPEAENEVKVILLGNGRVGKTQLCRRFRHEPFNSSIPSTHGVQIWRKKLRIQTAGQETAFQVNWWDFGGQDIYHGTHALFMRNRAIFLILWNPAFEDRKEFSENGLVLRNQPLAYWIDYVGSLAGKDSPVIVVQSQCDTFADRQPAPTRPNGFDFFETCSFSAQTDLGRETLEGQLRDAMRYLLERNGTLEIGRGRAEVRRRLYSWRSTDQQRTPDQREHRTLTIDEFRALCDEVGGIVSWEHALDYLHQTGVVFYRPELFSERIVLDQDWALEAVYTVFHRGKAVPWLRDSGRFTREDLAATVWQDHSLEEQKLFLSLMESCGVCFACGETPKGEDRYVAPDLLPKFDAVAVRLYAWKKDASTSSLRLEYSFFHQAIIRGLMSRIGWLAGEVAEYWKYGLWFKDGRRDTQLLLQFEDTSTNEVPGAGALVLKAQGQDPLGLLREIRKAILQQRIGEKPEELLTLDGITVARSALASVIDGRVLDLQRRPIPAAAYSAFFEDRRDPEEGRDAVKTTQMNIAPQRLTEIEKPPEIFISYGWGDPTPEGIIRAKAVDGLCSALEKDGFLPIRDRDQMHNGELISAFIRRLTRADHAVAIISDKYLRSPYCMFEIYKLWQKSQTEAEDMAQRVVPIVLPEVRIGNLGERAPYLRYWGEQAKRLEALVRDPDISPGGTSWQEFRLVREFAHHIDDILVFLNDVLMPRQLEVHLDNDFQAVREALRRRLRRSET